MSIKSYISKEEIPHSNWNQNDPNGEGYIEGRICYTTDPIETVLIDKIVEGFSKEEFSNGNTWYTVDPGVSFPLIDGETYIINWDGIEYIRTCFYSYGDYRLGNLVMWRQWDEGKDTGEPFLINYDESCIEFVSNSTETSHNIKITLRQSTIIPLDEKYISYKPGLIVKGKIYNIDNDEVIADRGAEIFNDYENNIASGEYSHAEGYNTTANGPESHSEGYGTIASGDSSHSEGYNTTASGNFSHAEGIITTASGTYSHSEGFSTTASGYNSHSEGHHTTASEHSSHAEGYYTIASGAQQHVQGKYNVEDTESKYANIIGNGTYTNRSNAHTVDWNGNAEYKGDVLANACGGENPISLINIYNKLQALLTVIESATAGQVIIADGNGGITAETIINGNEIEY